MATPSVVALLLLCSAGSALDVSVASSLTLKTGGATSPVTKIVTLLKDMLHQMEVEHNADEEIYDKMVCWCETNAKIKHKSISDMQGLTVELTLHVEDLTGLSAKLQTEIQHMDVFGVKLASSLEQATAIHAKDVKEWAKEEKDLLLSIEALRAAVIVLSKHHESLLQEKDMDASKILQVWSEHADMFRGVLTPSQNRALAAFFKAPAGFLGIKGDFLQVGDKQPASGEIYGILKQMQETFSRNLAEGQEDAGANIKTYGETKSGLDLQILSNQELHDKKVSQLADTDDKLVKLQIDIIEITAILKADKAYLKMLNEKCEMTDKEWEARQKTRAQEAEAISKALAMLASDDAHAMFGRTLGLVQVRREAKEGNRLQSQAAALLKSVGEKLNSPRLVALAVHARLDAFAKVKEAIAKMIRILTKEKTDEIKHKDFCVSELHNNAMATQAKTHDKKVLTSQIEDLKLSIKTLTKEVAEEKKTIEEMEVQIKRGGQDRELENIEFKKVVADQRATQKLLAEAYKVLEPVLDSLLQKQGVAAHYYESESTSMASTEDQEVKSPSTKIIVKSKTIVHEVKAAGPAGPDAPGGFGVYEKKGGGVLGMLREIMADAKAMEAETIHDEEDAQKAYEDFVMETNASIDASNQEIITKSKEKAKEEVSLVEAEEALATTEEELEGLADEDMTLHHSCDYILKNFGPRQEARDQEIEALKQASAILSGAKFSAFLESGH